MRPRAVYLVDYACFRIKASWLLLATDNGDSIRAGELNKHRGLRGGAEEEAGVRT